MRILQLLLPALLCLHAAYAANLTIVNPIKFYDNNPPLWLTSPFFRAGNKAVISTLTGNNTTPTFTFTFSSALPGLPMLTYGIKNYRGNDYMGEQFFQIKRTGLTASTFKVSIQIYGYTNLWLLNVAYLAVDPTFPHFFTTFDNVPLNYSSGPIVNISAKSVAPKYFTEYINYTKQATGLAYNTFPQPLTSTVIVLFMTSLWIKGTFKTTQFWPIQFHISSQILNSSFYMLKATLKTNVMITNVHFSQIIFNSVDILSSQKYYVIYGLWYNDVNGGFTPIPQAFVDNFIMGLTAFQNTGTQCGFEYQWEFSNSSGSFGVQMPYSMNIPKTCGFSWSQSSMVYIQTWLCLPPYVYYNISTGMCQTDCGGFHTANNVSEVCEPCNNTLCYTCDIPNDSSYCTDCASWKNYQLVNGSCLCPLDYIEFGSSCTACDQINPGCVNCTYNQANGKLPFNSTQFTCYECNETLGYFINDTTSACQTCSIADCDLCINLTACQVCATGLYFTPILTCEHCFIIGCQTCQLGDPNNCYGCKIGYSMNANNITCEPICGDGIVTPTEVCDAGLLNGLIGTGCAIDCTIVAHYTCNTSLSPSVCTPICGDGFVLSPEQCDDGNLYPGDGCSATCTFEEGFTCSGEPSVCTSLCGNGVVDPGEGCDAGARNGLDGSGCNQYCQLVIVLSYSSVVKNTNECNSLTFFLKFNAFQTGMETIDYSKFVLFYNSRLINPVYEYRATDLKFTWNYDGDMAEQVVKVFLNTSYFIGSLDISTDESCQSIVVIPSNNVQATYLDPDQCKTRSSLMGASSAVLYMSYGVLIMSALPAKIVGLELFGVLQLAYISLGSIDQLNVMLAPLLALQGSNGLSMPFVNSQKTQLPSRIKGINYYPSFLDNFNVMLLLMVCELFIAIIFYIITKILKSVNATLAKVADHMLKQFFLTLILFNAFNIAYSTAIHFKYDSDSSYSIASACSIITNLAILAMAVAIIFVKQQGFGEFKDKFGKDPVQSNYFTFTILYRMSLGFLLGYANEDDLSTLWAVGISLFFVIYNLINLPFNKAYHNYRACLCHCSQFVLLFVGMFYRSMTSSRSVQEVSYIFSPAKLSIALIIICTVISLLVAVYDLYQFIKQRFCWKKAKQSNEINNEIHSQAARQHSNLQLIQSLEKHPPTENCLPINNQTEDYFV